jgi:uncharacterized repeat protein (TIGR03806 family)
MAVLSAACGSSSAPCTPGGGGGYVNGPYQTIAEYCLVEMTDAGIQPKPGVLPYDLNTPLFSDYAVKLRTVWMPGDVAATYDDGSGDPSVALAFPDGTLISKSFGMRDDWRKPNPQVHWIETRILAKVDGGWHAYTYAWNDAQTEATYDPAGGTVPISFIIQDGGTLTANYLIPSQNQCKLCHQNGAVIDLIGPKARQLNKDYAYPDGSENQLVRWGKVGFLTGAPDPASAPVLPVWNDPSTGSVEQRARAYLEGNCAHCHNPNGSAASTGLTLWASETDPARYGICKTPVAAGPATGGFLYDIVPGYPDASIVTHRIESTELQVRMPQIERSVVDADGVELVADWIASLDGGCG